MVTKSRYDLGIRILWS